MISYIDDEKNDLNCDKNASYKVDKKRLSVRNPAATYGQNISDICDEYLKMEWLAEIITYR